MIPLRLRLKNFLGYREPPPLSLEGVRLACLSGDNGAGKSSLLDAMTWALWGEARGKNDDDLIHLGQTEMEVELEFAVGTSTQGESSQRYRVLRKHRRSINGHPSQTILELHAASYPVSPEGWRPITGNSLRDTQHKIRDILHLEYDTFINSAFLIQGRADEFTIKAPSKRKELLAEILGLSYYEKLERQAKEKREESKTQLKIMDSDLENIEKELVLKPSYKAELQQIQEALAPIASELRSQEATLSSLRQKQGELEAKEEELKRLSSQLAQAQKELEIIANRQRECKNRISGYEELLSQRQAIEVNYGQLLQARKEAELWNDKLLALNALQQQQNRLEHVIKDARAGLERELALFRRQVLDMEVKARALPQLQQSISQANARLAELQLKETALKQKRQNAQEIRDEISGLQSSYSQIGKEIDSLNEKLSLLSQGDARCPLCESELGLDGKQRLEVRYRNEIQVKVDTRNTTQRSLGNKQKEYRSLVQETDDSEARLKRDMTAAHRQLAELEKDMNQAQLAQDSLVSEKDKLAVLESCLAKGEYAHDEQAQLGKIKGQITALGYDSAKHFETRKRLQGLEPIDLKKRQLDEAEIHIQSERLSLSQTIEALAQAQERQKELERKRGDLMAELAYGEELTARLHKAEESYRALQAQERGYRDKLAAARSNLERCHILEQAKGEKETLRAGAAREESIYRDLAEAFGKKGVPALLIEAALPELEAEANRLLSRMTENQMNIKLETQREHKGGKGEPIETLDIKISDELGTRDYEMFSGGEAFRINFALRIALSKLLARRAGAPLPTLVIDEGFGTQDSSGREKLVEAINSIQEDFERILVITHIEEMKDLFPVRIEVAKTSEGSTFRVVE